MDLLSRTQYCRRCRAEKPSDQFLRLRQKLPLQDITNRESVREYVRRENPKLLKTCDACSEKEKPRNTARSNRLKGTRLARRVMQNGDGNDLDRCDFSEVIETLRGSRGGFHDSYNTSQMSLSNASVFSPDLAVLLSPNSTNSSTEGTSRTTGSLRIVLPLS
jgi:hypothetical protein